MENVVDADLPAPSLAITVAVPMSVRGGVNKTAKPPAQETVRNQLLLSIVWFSAFLTTK